MNVRVANGLIITGKRVERNFKICMRTEKLYIYIPDDAISAGWIQLTISSFEWVFISGNSEGAVAVRIWLVHLPSSMAASDVSCNMRNVRVCVHSAAHTTRTHIACA